MRVIVLSLLLTSILSSCTGQKNTVVSETDAPVLSPVQATGVVIDIPPAPPAPPAPPVEAPQDIQVAPAQPAPAPVDANQPMPTESFTGENQPL